MPNPQPDALSLKEVVPVIKCLTAPYWLGDSKRLDDLIFSLEFIDSFDDVLKNTNLLRKYAAGFPERVPPIEQAQLKKLVQDMQTMLDHCADFQRNYNALLNENTPALAEVFYDSMGFPPAAKAAFLASAEQAFKKSSAKNMFAFLFRDDCDFQVAGFWAPPSPKGEKPHKDDMDKIRRWNHHGVESSASDVYSKPEITGQFSKGLKTPALARAVNLYLAFANLSTTMQSLEAFYTRQIADITPHIDPDPSAKKFRT